MHAFEPHPDNGVTSLGSADPASFFHAAISTELAVALWRLPGHTHPQGVVDLSDEVRRGDIHFQTDQPAFVFAPFSAASGSQPLHLQADVRLAADGLHPQQSLWNGRQQRFDAFNARFRARHTASDTLTPRWHLPARPLHLHDSTLAEYRHLVAEALQFILANNLKKVVVSRTTSVPLPAGFDPMALFTTLCQRYPMAFVSLVAVPGVGTWIGASPEMLLATDHHGLNTVALAGTQVHPPGSPLETVRWSHKEIEEQALVSDYIRAFFRGVGVTPVHEAGPRTIAAGNVVHLRTDFRVELPRPAWLALADRVLHELHPTSAVCGMPKDKALAFILAHEGYDRSFYSGYLGPMHLDGASHLFVNLRCMQLDHHSAHLYMGGGVTADSQPDAEWRETQWKADTLLAALYPERTAAGGS